MRRRHGERRHAVGKDRRVLVGAPLLTRSYRRDGRLPPQPHGSGTWGRPAAAGDTSTATASGRATWKAACVCACSPDSTTGGGTPPNASAAVPAAGSVWTHPTATRDLAAWRA